jgi:prepilin-type N-terminal cleavage/methylation domain-containing protein
MKRVPKGVTLIELLVVLGVVSVLVALLVPAVQAAREAGRRAQCASHVKQVVLAMQSYHSAQRVLPLNGQGFSAPSTSWLMGVLPYLEQEAIYKKIDFRKPLSDPGNAAVSLSVVPLLLCPSDSGNGVAENRCDDVGARAVSNYKAVGGANWEFGDHFVSQPKGRWAGKTNGLCFGNGILCAGTYAWAPCPRINTTQFAQIFDGMSNTFAIGEAVSDWSRWVWWFGPNGSTGTCAIPLNYRLGQVDLHAEWDDWGRNCGFFSRHPGGAHFGLCDGLVRFVSDKIDLETYRALATISSRDVGQLP